MEGEATQPEKTEQAMGRPWTAAAACVLGLLLPGAGHVVAGRWQRGLFFLGALLTLFVLGLSMDARLTLHMGLDDPLALVIGLGQVAMGLPYLAARALSFAAGDVRAAGFDYGVTFTATGGLLNMLVALDAMDVALGRKP
jgi:hypothetical protein